jgi:tubulin monoglycylase TTLL3/8
MWELGNFKKYLKENYNKENIWDEIYEKMKNAIICSFDSGRHEIVYRENCFELYGYDFMIDNELNVFLIEINSSPAMDYSTSITERLVKENLGNIIQIVVDNKNNLGNCNQIGKYVKIYDGNCDVNEKFLPNK